MHLLIQLNDNYNSWKELTEENYALLRDAFPTLPAEKPSWAPDNSLLLTDENKHLLVQFNLSFKISKEEVKGTVGQALVKLADRMDSLEADVKKRRNLAELESHGAAVQIHVPDFTLMTITEVEVLDDCCTDMLQRHLDDGWRILAVCPPNAQRRPDYVLGRSKTR